MKVKIYIYRYPFVWRGPPWKFEPRIVRGRIIGEEATEEINQFILSLVKKEKGVDLAELYRCVQHVSPPPILEFPKPLEVELGEEETKRVYEILMKHNVSLKVTTAEKLFGKEFAKRVREHNKKIER